MFTYTNVKVTERVVITTVVFISVIALQCFNNVGWVTTRASALSKGSPLEDLTLPTVICKKRPIKQKLNVLKLGNIVHSQTKTQTSTCVKSDFLGALQQLLPDAITDATNDS